MWGEIERESCLTTFVEESEPTVDEELAVLFCMEALREVPRPPESNLLGEAHGIFPEGRIVDVPGTDVICIYYAVYDETQSIHWLWIARA